jgi:crotonobetainyl-CoA:carnitine CoA-transferase CaiB-like acyl-CoA transferase
MTATHGPLDGLVVCDLSTVLAGPYCSMLLGDLGADVIKVEPPGGDPTRRYGPPFVPPKDESGGSASGEADEGESGYYLSVNRNKRDIQLDLSTPAGADVLERLLVASDVLIENFRPGAFARLGFDDGRLEAINPRLVRLSITGYGPTGPDSDRPGFDFIIQAVSGLMSITGMPDAEGGAPTKVGLAIADLTTGMLGAVAILAALRWRDGDGREGSGSGQGQRIDTSLLGSVISWSINQATNHLIGGVVPERMGNQHPNIAPYETFPTSDGDIAVAVGSERQWHRLCDAMGLDDLAVDPRFATNGDRVRHREELRSVLVDAFARRGAADWHALLVAAEVPVGEVRDMAQVFSDPQVLRQGMVVEVDHPTIGPIRLPGMPWQLRATPGSIRRAPPTLGQDTESLLAWLGFGPDDVAAMRRDLVI